VHEINLIAEFFTQPFETGLRGRQIDFFRFIDQWTDPVGAFALCERAAGRVV
jgi:hypothetical protein